MKPERREFWHRLWVKRTNAGLDVPYNAYPWGGSRREKRMWKKAFGK